MQSSSENKLLPGLLTLSRAVDHVPLRSNQPSLLSPSLEAVLERVREEIGFIDSPTNLSSEEIRTLILAASESLALELTSYEIDSIQVHLEQDNQLFGPLQRLVDDDSVSDIIVTNYSKVAVQRGRENYDTDIKFSSQKAYENFVERLLQKAGSSYSTKRPIADGMISDYARIHVVHKALCESGPYLTIRLNRFGKVTIEDLLKSGSAPATLFHYLSAMVRSGKTLLIAGEVGTGKTTLVRALASSISGNESILVIEDTPEIKLEHAHVRYMTTREENLDGEGTITPSQCIRAGMRMAMNRVIFGEMRDAVAAESFIDVCASGHPGMSTIHARSAIEAIARLELFLGRAQKGTPKNILSAQIAQAVQAIVFVQMCQQTGKRRIVEVMELTGAADDVIRQRQLYRYKVIDGFPEWMISNGVSAFAPDLKEHGFEFQGNRMGTLSLDDSVVLQETCKRLF